MQQVEYAAICKLVCWFMIGVLLTLNYWLTAQLQRTLE
jgi:Flp pilus assembly pilin Flp